MTRHRALTAVRAALLGLAIAACAPPIGAPTRLEVTTIETICGGAFHPDLPSCRSNAVSRPIEVLRGRTVVAAATTDVTGHAVVDVPAADLVVSVPDAPSYMDCDSPSVVASGGTTTPVIQTCTVLVP